MSLLDWPHKDGGMDQSAGWETREKGMAQFLGKPVNVSEVVFGAVELCASKCGETWTRVRCESVSVVFGGLVGAERFGRERAECLQV
jgi:hypothetical protein